MVDDMDIVKFHCKSKNSEISVEECVKNYFDALDDDNFDSDCLVCDDGIQAIGIVDNKLDNEKHGSIQCKTCGLMLFDHEPIDKVCLKLQKARVTLGILSLAIKTKNPDYLLKAIVKTLESLNE